MTDLLWDARAFVRVSLMVVARFIVEAFEFIVVLLRARPDESFA